ncbi:MAG: TRAP transporter small permease subunit [Hyphomicrobiales bacterium]
MGREARTCDKHSGFLKSIQMLMLAPPHGKRTTIIDRIVSVFSRLAMLLILVGVSITLYEIVMRYVFESATTWVNKTTLWLAAVTYLISGILVMQRREHIRVTVIYDLVSPKMRLAFDCVALYVLITFTTLMLVGSAGQVWVEFSHAVKTGTIWGLPMGPTIKPLVLLASVAVTIVAINNFLLDHLNIGRSHHSSQPVSQSDHSTE